MALGPTEVAVQTRACSPPGGSQERKGLTPREAPTRLAAWHPPGADSELWNSPQLPHTPRDWPGKSCPTRVRPREPSGNPALGVARTTAARSAGPGGGAGPLPLDGQRAGLPFRPQRGRQLRFAGGGALLDVRDRISSKVPFATQRGSWAEVDFGGNRARSVRDPVEKRGGEAGSHSTSSRPSGGKTPLLASPFTPPSSLACAVPLRGCDSERPGGLYHPSWTVGGELEVSGSLGLAAETPTEIQVHRGVLVSEGRSRSSAEDLGVLEFKTLRGVERPNLPAGISSPTPGPPPRWILKGPAGPRAEPAEVLSPGCAWTSGRSGLGWPGPGWRWPWHLSPGHPARGEGGQHGPGGSFPTGWASNLRGCVQGGGPAAPPPLGRARAPRAGRGRGPAQRPC